MTGGFPQHHIMGIRHDGQGVIDEQNKIAWHYRTPNWVSYVRLADCRRTLFPDRQ